MHIIVKMIPWRHMDNFVIPTTRGMKTQHNWYMYWNCVCIDPNIKIIDLILFCGTMLELI